MPSEAMYEEVELSECYKCGRKFAVDRLSKHEKVCKAAEAPHKPKHPRPVFKDPKPKKSGGVPKWKAQHEELVQSMKYMRKIKAAQEAGISLRDLPPPPSTSSHHDDRVPCPHCGRKFEETVAARHIPACANTVNKPKGPPGSSMKQSPYATGAMMSSSGMSTKSPAITGKGKAPGPPNYGVSSSSNFGSSQKGGAFGGGGARFGPGGGDPSKLVGGGGGGMGMSLGGSSAISSGKMAERSNSRGKIVTKGPAQSSLKSHQTTKGSGSSAAFEVSGKSAVKPSDAGRITAKDFGKPAPPQERKRSRSGNRNTKIISGTSKGLGFNY